MQREDLLDALYRAYNGENPKKIADELLGEPSSLENDANVYEVEKLFNFADRRLSGDNLRW